MTTSDDPPAPPPTAWMLARKTLVRLYRGKTGANTDPALVCSDMEEREQGRIFGGPRDRLALTSAYAALLDHVRHLADVLRERGVDLSRDDYTPMLDMSNDTRELYEAKCAAIVRAVGIRGIIRRDIKKAAP